MEIIMAVFWVVFIMIIWFDTDAFVRYTNLLGIDDALYLHEFHTQKKEELEPLDYASFIRQHDENSFFVALFSCQTCLCFWVSLVASCVFTGAHLIPVTYILSLSVYLFIRKYLMR